MNEARTRGWKVEGQKEMGENGTIHYQLLLKTPQVRFSAVKKAFPRAHIEPAKNFVALKQYVHKESTRIDTLDESKNDKYPSPTKLMALYARYVSDNFRGILAKYGKVFADLNGHEMLKVFDDCIRHLINDGYYVEGLAVNPQIRSSVKNYGQEIIYRENARVNTQTDGVPPTAVQEEDEREQGEGGSAQGDDARSQE